MSNFLRGRLLSVRGAQKCLMVEIGVAESLSLSLVKQAFFMARSLEKLNLI